jgi:hypothetical protein
MKLPSDFKELLEEFAREGVEHVVIGGYAFAYHAEPRATKDLDIFLEGSPANLERASRALARYGAPPNVVEATRHLGATEVARSHRPREARTCSRQAAKIELLGRALAVLVPRRARR